MMSIILVCILILIPYGLNGRSLKTSETISEYECGFEPFDSAIRQPFTVEFYIIGILFLIFDVEITLVLP
jgi:NADH-ubiquinone oxidoreductase chain 3